jgi:peroxiredoxin
LDALDTAKKPVSLDEYRGKNVILIFYIGQECSHCIAQLNDLGKRAAELKALDVEVLAASSNTPEQNAMVKDAKARLLSDASFENARRFKSYDDFEEMPLHSTLLIDKQGRVHWARQGGAPFTDFEILLKEIKRLNAWQEMRAGGSPAAKDAPAEKSSQQ